MTAASTHLRIRSESFHALADLYNTLANDPGLEPAERAIYDDIADLLNKVVCRFVEGADELDERAGMRLPFRVSPADLGEIVKR